MESRSFNHVITAVIVFNAIVLGLETSQSAMRSFGTVLLWIDRTALIIFTVELMLRLAAHRGSFFKGGWNLFDLVIVTISWLPAAGAFSVLRALRVLRVLRLLSIIPQMRIVVGALLTALPGMGSVMALLVLVYYVFAVMAVKLFGTEFPEYFGTLGEAFFSLFQVMTLESWSMGMARPVMEVFPHAWTFFVPFVVITSFMVLNLFIGLVVNSMQTVHQQDLDELARREDVAHDEREQLLQSLEKVHEELREIRSRLD